MRDSVTQHAGILTRGLVLFCLLAALGAPARAAKGEKVARALLAGELSPAEAAQLWKRSRLSPAKAAKLIRSFLPFARAPRKNHQVTLEDRRGRSTDAQVVLPDRPQEDGSYRVLVLLHGLGGDSSQGATLGRSLEPLHTIVVAPSAQKPPEEAPAEDLRAAALASLPIMDRFPHWWSYREDAFPLLALAYLRARYPLDSDRVVIAGYSMGGFGTWNLGLRFQDRFAGLAALAGGISRQEWIVGRDDLVRGLLGNARQLPVLAVHGDQDAVVPVRFDRWTHEDLQKANIEHVYEEVPGGKHVLRNELEGELGGRIQAWLRERVRDPHPRRVEHHAIGAYHGGAYWVRIDAFAGNDGAGRVVAEVTGDNAITVTTEGVAQLTLYLDPELVDPGKSIQVSLNGSAAFAGKVKPSLQAVAESFGRTGDPSLVYEHAILLKIGR